MGNKIFVSYKYADSRVQPLPGHGIFTPTTVRNYVDKLQEILDWNDHINKGENDNEDISHFKNSTIESKLRNKIFDSSVTIVLISKGMKDLHKNESEQWIPWEISYSLSEHRRNGRVSKSNAILAVVIPDEYASYSYYLDEKSCTQCNCRIIQNDVSFNIIASNMFNVKKPVFSECDNHSTGPQIFMGESSYIEAVKWSDFNANPQWYINNSISLRDRIDNFHITKVVA